MIIIDRRRISRDRSTENRSRFIKRYKDAIKRQLPEILNKRKLAENDSPGMGGGRVKINRKTIKEPTFHFDEGGVVDTVLPGNENFTEGDLIAKPLDGGGQSRGRQAGDGEDEDDFDVDLSREEFLDLIFDDLELPNLTKTDLINVKDRKVEHAGFQSEGPPNRLSLVRTYKQSLARRIPVVADLLEQLELLQVSLKAAEEGGDIAEVERLKLEIARVQQEMDEVPLFDDIDLRYKATVVREIPKLHATMIMIMDNSGSMGLREKTIARKFFLILYLFLRRNYEKVTILPISHTVTARVLSEEDFFNTHESGGTLVSSALDLASDAINEGVPETDNIALKGKTNIYIAQVSDGDNLDTDNGTCTEVIEDEILPYVRYFAYVQVDDYHNSEIDTTSHLLTFGKGLWKSYETLVERHKHFNIKRVTEEKDIFPVFVELFKKRKR